MTYRERLMLERPEFIDPLCDGGCKGCPYASSYESEKYGLCKGGAYDNEMCTKCWDQEIPGSEPFYKLKEGAREVVDSAVKAAKSLEDAMAQCEDMVNHPGHYESGKFECIDVMLETQGKEAVMGFCICNAFKYLYRHNRKNGIEDVKKAVWYLNKYLEILEEMK